MGKRPETQEKVLKVLLSLEMSSTSDILSELNNPPKPDRDGQINEGSGVKAESESDKKDSNFFTHSRIEKPLKSLAKKGYISGVRENGRTMYSLCTDIATVKRLYNDPQYIDLRDSLWKSQEIRDHLLQIAFPEGLPPEYRGDLGKMLQSSRMIFEVFLSLQDPRGDLTEYADLLNWHPRANPLALESLIERNFGRETNAPALFQMYLFLYAAIQVIEREGFTLCNTSGKSGILGFGEQNLPSNETVRKYKEKSSAVVAAWNSFGEIRLLNEYIKLTKSRSQGDADKKQELKAVIEESDPQLNRFLMAITNGAPEQSNNIREGMIKASEKLKSILYAQK